MAGSSVDMVLIPFNPFQECVHEGSVFSINRSGFAW
jgi:hypothetical protein